MLKSIFIVTMLVNQLDVTETAYARHLQYRTVERGTVAAQTASAWGADGMRDRRFVLMQPESGAEVYLRFIEDPAANSAPPPLTTHGWAATELLVTDLDALAARLTDSPFQVIGPPRDLYAAPKAPRAMQVSGPSQEILYFTRAIPGGSRFELGQAQTFVDRTFIVVVGGPSMADLRRFYADTLALAPAEPTPFIISVLARANDLPADSTFPLAVIQLAPGHLIELDEYPPATRARPVRAAELPPRMSMVTFLGQIPAGVSLPWRAPPKALSTPPYAGRQAGVLVGSAGEWIEIVTDPAP